MKIQAKLLSGYMALVAIVVILGLIAINSNRLLRHELEVVGEDISPMISALQDLRFAGLRIISSTSEHGFITAELKHIPSHLQEELESAAQQEERELLEAGAGLAQKALKDYGELLLKYAPQEMDKHKRISQIFNEFELQSLKITSSIARGIEGQPILELKEQFEEMEQHFLGLINSLIEKEKQKVIDAEQKARDVAQIVNQKIIVFCLLSIFTALLLSFVLSRMVSRPIFALDRAAQKIGRDELDFKLSPSSNDEIGTLTNAFNNMVGNIKALQKRKAEIFLELDQIFNTVTVGLRTVDKNYTILDVNDTFAFMAGGSREYIVGEKCFDIFPGEACQTSNCPMKMIFEKGKDKVEYECSRRRLDNQLTPCLVSATAFRNTAGETIGILEEFKDITEIRKTQDNLIEAKTEAEKSNQAKSEFLTNMSHEIRTPMNGIVGATDLLQQTTNLAEGQQEYLEIIGASSQRLLHLVNNILDFAKIEAEMIELQETVFSLHHLAQEVVSFFEVIIKKKDLTISSLISKHVPEFYLGDPDRLRQILVNLINNAIKFTQEGQITLEIDCDINWDGETPPEENPIVLHLSVADTGEGIPPESISSIFESFTQVDGSISRKKQGAGLGLAITKQLVTIMGGQIWVTSELGSGSTFHFTSLMKTASADQVIAPSCSLMPHLTKRQGSGSDSLSDKSAQPPQSHLLLVDDEEINQTLASAMLEGLGHTVTVASNGQEALDILEKAPSKSFNFILMDIQMPEMDGFDTTAAIRETERQTGDHIPIIATTAHAIQGYREKCLDSGMDDYISKPIDFDLLQKKLSRFSSVS